MKFIKIIGSIALTVAVMATSMSCKDDKPEVQPEPTLSVIPSDADIVFSADGATATADGKDIPNLYITVETNQSPWDVKVSANPWLTVTKWSANTFRMTAKANTEFTPPAPVEITVTAGEAKPVKIRVQQLGVAPSLIVTPEYREIIFSFDGELAITPEGKPFIPPVFFVATNLTQWDAVSDQLWLKVTNDKDNNRFTLTVDNTGAKPFTDANVAVTAGNAPLVNITVKFQEQKKADYFPVLAWGSIPEAYLTAARFAELREAGFTHSLEHINPPNIPLCLNLAQQVGVKVILNPHGVLVSGNLESFLNVVRNHMNHPAVGGYYISDEPWGKEFNFVKEAVRRVREIDPNPDKWAYINLHPNQMGNDVYAPATNYRGHVQMFLPIMDILSFDHYPITANTAGVRSLSSRWYENLEIISDEARKVYKPFSAFAYAGESKEHNYPASTLEDIRLQVYSNLAYGAQSIQYYAYWGWWNTSSSSPIFNGQRTPVYDIVKQVNQEIKDLSGVFLNATVLQVRHYVMNSLGLTTPPTGTTSFSFANRPASAQSAITSFSATGTYALVVSFLQNDNRTYMVVINRNLMGGANATINIGCAPHVRRIKKDGTEEMPPTGNQTLAPCDMWIFGWNN